jgi:hypothetical protein
MFILEDGGSLHIAAATPREWLETGLGTGVKEARSWYGVINFSIKRGRGNLVEIELSSSKILDIDTVLHVRLPRKGYKLKVEKCGIPGATVNGETVTVPGGSRKDISLVIGIY